jgi:hypothetical protein
MGEPSELREGLREHKVRGVVLAEALFVVHGKIAGKTVLAVEASEDPEHGIVPLAEVTLG